VLLEGVFEKRRFLDLVRYFVVFEDEGGGKLIKKMAGYHQFHAVNAAIEETLRAAMAASSPRRGSRSPTSRSSRTSSSPKCEGFRSATSPSSCCRSC
jgi:type I restriction enzyme R subunit